MAFVETLHNFSFLLGTVFEMNYSFLFSLSQIAFINFEALKI